MLKIHVSSWSVWERISGVYLGTIVRYSYPDYAPRSRIFMTNWTFLRTYEGLGWELGQMIRTHFVRKIVSPTLTCKPSAFDPFFFMPLSRPQLRLDLVTSKDPIEYSQRVTKIFGYRNSATLTTHKKQKLDSRQNYYTGVGVQLGLTFNAGHCMLNLVRPLRLLVSFNFSLVWDVWDGRDRIYMRVMGAWERVKRSFEGTNKTAGRHNARECQ